MTALLYHFWSQVLGRSTICQPSIIIVEVIGPTKICQLDDAVHVEQNVLGLDVPMNDRWIERVKVLHRCDALTQVLRGNFLAKASLFFEQGIDLALRTILQYKVKVVIILIMIVQLQNVIVIQFVHDFDL